MKITLNNILTKYSLILISTFSLCYGELTIGDTVNFELPICANQNPLDIENIFKTSRYNGHPDSTQSRVIYLTIFTSW